jgi:hypothetical protein
MLPTYAPAAAAPLRTGKAEQLQSRHAGCTAHVPLEAHSAFM